VCQDAAASRLVIPLPAVAATPQVDERAAIITAIAGGTAAGAGRAIPSRSAAAAVAPPTSTATTSSSSSSSSSAALATIRAAFPAVVLHHQVVPQEADALQLVRLEALLRGRQPGRPPAQRQEWVLAAAVGGSRARRSK
jgi:hypothetical protein